VGLQGKIVCFLYSIGLQGKDIEQKRFRLFDSVDLFYGI